MSNCKLKNILIISHDASQTGAPIGLLHFLRWLKKEKVNFSIILRDGGVLKSDFENLCSTYEFCPKEYHSNSFFKRVGYKFYLKKLFQKIKAEKFDYIYSNTIVNANVLIFLSPLKLKTLTHIRELESTIEHFGGQSNLDNINLLSDKFICVGNNVKKMLHEQYNLPLDKMEVVHEYINPVIAFSVNEVRGKIRKELSIPENSFVVGACGGVDWRKGYDYFVQLAAYYIENFKNVEIYFLWVGGITKTVKEKIVFDLKRYGIELRVKFIGVKLNPMEYFAAMDIFFLTSREEPGGLVSLEAGALEIPVIVCDKTGGVVEFVEDDAGIIIPYLSIKKGCDAINRLYLNASLRIKLGENAREKVIKNHSIEKASSAILHILTSIYK
jgi:glycosyltransferase involved in cell wall biosynthesis